MNIYQRLAAAMADVTYIQKEKKQGMRYTIVSHDAVTAKVRPALLKHGIVYHPIGLEFDQVGNRTEVCLAVRFVNIEDPADFFDVPSLGYGIDDQDKGPGKAISYAVKYALLKALGLETGDDPDLDQEVTYSPPGEPLSAHAMKRDFPEEWPELERDVRAATNRGELTAVWNKHRERRAKWPKAWREKADEMFSDRAGEVADRSTEVIDADPASAAEPLTHPVRYRNTHGAPVGKVRADYFQTTEEDIEGFRKKAAAE